MKETVLKCFRTACNNAAHPCGYNRVTHGLYCLTCARNIEVYAQADRDSFYPLLALADQVTEGGSWEAGLIVTRTAP